MSGAHAGRDADGLPLEPVAEYCSAHVGLHYRAVGLDDEGAISWFWRGRHANYDKLIGQQTIAADAFKATRGRNVS